MKKITLSLLAILSLFLFVGASIQGGKLILDIVELKGYTSATDSNRTEEVDPISEKYVYTTLFDVTNGTDAGGSSCPAGTDYCYYVDMSGFRKGNFQLELDSDAGTVTATVEGTMEDGCAPASCSYIDITNDTFGVAQLQSAGAPASDMWNDNAEKLAGYKYVMIRIEAATGGNTGDWTGYHKRLY